jgi:predicted DNA-binding antitoxin AbrB/MazE fold protein
VKAICENGVFKPQEPIRLEEHTEVDVVIPATAPSDADDPTGRKAIQALIGFIDDAPADMTERHDEYLGTKCVPFSPSTMRLGSQAS